MHKNARKEFHLWGKHIFTLLAPPLWALIYEERKWFVTSQKVPAGSPSEGLR